MEAAASLAEIACNDDFCGLQSRIEWSTAAGTTYLIRLGGYASAFGTGTLLANALQPPLNDNCAGAIPVFESAPLTFDNRAATASGTAFACGGGGSDVWFTFTPAATGDFDIDTCGSAIDPVVAKFQRN